MGRADAGGTGGRTPRGGGHPPGGDGDGRARGGPRGASGAPGRSKHSVVIDREVWRELGRLAIDLETDRSRLLEDWARERIDRYKRSGRDLAPAAGVPPLAVVRAPAGGAAPAGEGARQAAPGLDSGAA